MKQHVRIEHDEPVSQVLAREPQRIQAAGRCKLNVLDEADLTNLLGALLANAVAAETDDDDDLFDVQTAKRFAGARASSRRFPRGTSASPLRRRGACLFLLLV